MTKKICIVLIMIIQPLIIHCQENSITARNHFEVSIKYSLQRPFYSVTNPIDIVAFSHETRYRSRLGIGCRYYVFENWFSEFNLAYSQEGGGFKNQFTNTNYLKNGMNIGFSTAQNRRIVFDIYTGFDLGMLLCSKLKNQFTDESENVKNYHKRFSVSFPVLGAGFKTEIYENTFLSAQTYFSMTNYRVSTEENTTVSQVIFPAFQISLSRFLK
jgi:hypothetical protein